MEISGSGGGCFIGSTSISIPTGIKPIQDVQVGDEVLCFDANRQIHISTVRTVSYHPLKPVIRLRYWGGELWGTPNHYLLNEENAFQELSSFEIDAPLFDNLWNVRPVEELDWQPPQDVYNLTVDRYHTYFANGIAVHNGGGGKQRSGSGGVEAANNLRSRSTVNLVEAISEGEIAGLVDGYKSIYLDNTPIQNQDGTYNFQGFRIETRNGTPTQSYIPGFGSGIETEFSVNTPVTVASGTVTRSISNPNADGARVRISIPALQEFKDNGDITDTSVRYKIYVKAGLGMDVLRVDETLTGKTNAPYEREYYLPFAGLTPPISIKVERVTPDSTSTRVQNEVRWAAYVEVIEVKLNYPNTAIVAASFDAEQFSNIPTRAYEIKGMLIKIPVNATPRADGSLVYSGVWDGSFKVAWSSDPAWCLYDLLINTRYGAGISESIANKWAFLPISQYCSQLVPDGFGGMEPRFSLNCYLQTKEEAYQVINALCSVMQAMPYWSESGITVVQDSPKQPTRQFTNANVTKFQYSGSAKRARHTVAMVAWNDPTDFYRQRLEVVEDPEGIAMWGVREVQLTAFGCTSRGQAHRVGKWLLYSERMETETVTFQTGSEGIPMRPGEIVKILDNKRAGRRLAGRIAAATGTQVTLDAPVTLNEGENHELTVTFPNGQLASRAIAQTGTLSTINASFDPPPIPGTIWIISSSALTPATYRVLGIVESEPHVYEISALQHALSKHQAIEQGIILEPALPRIVPPTPPTKPRNLSGEIYSYIENQQIYYVLRASWDYPLLDGKRSPFTSRYLIEYKIDLGGIWYASETYGLSADFKNVTPNSNYYLRVAAIDTLGRQSDWLETGAIASTLPNLVMQFDSPLRSIAAAMLL